MGEKSCRGSVKVPSRKRWVGREGSRARENPQLGIHLKKYQTGQGGDKRLRDAREPWPEKKILLFTAFEGPIFSIFRSPGLAGKRGKITIRLMPRGGIILTRGRFVRI